MSLPDVYTMMGTILGILTPIIIIIMYVKKEICRDLTDLKNDTRLMRVEMRDDLKEIRDASREDRATAVRDSEKNP